MSKLFYYVLGSIALLLIITFVVLSYIDRTMLDPSKAPSEKSISGTTAQLSKEPYHGFSSAKKGDSSSLPSPPSTEQPRNKTKPPPSLNVRLVGTTVFGEKSSVILEDRDKGTQGLYRLGDTIKGFTITDILKDSVTLTKQDQEVVLTLAQGSHGSSSEPFAKKVGDNSWLLSADKVTDIS